jgi:hypothetical protein
MFELTGTRRGHPEEEATRDGRVSSADVDPPSSRTVIRMRRTMAAAALLVALLSISPMASAKPSSFAAWHRYWKTHADAKVTAAKLSCAVPNSSDTELGECVAKVLLAAYPPLIAQWNIQVANVAKGQIGACRGAIRDYWLATSRNYAETVAFFRAHRHAALTAIATDARAQKYHLLGLNTLNTANRVVRICG